MVIGRAAPDFNAVNNSVIEKITNFLKNIQFDYDPWSVWMWAEGQEENAFKVEGKDGKIQVADVKAGESIKEQRPKMVFQLELIILRNLV